VADIIPVGSVDVDRLDYWTGKLQACLAKSVEAVLEAGVTVVEAKADLGDVGLTKLAEAVGIDRTTTYYLERIGNSPALFAHANALPASLRALGELSRLDPEALEAAIEEGLVSPDLTVKGAQELARGPADGSLVDADGGETAADPQVTKSQPRFAELRDEAVFSVERGRLGDAVAVIMRPEFRLTVEVAQDILRALRPLEEARSTLLQILDDEVGDVVDLPVFSMPRPSRVIPVDPRDPAQVAGTAQFEASQAPHAGAI